MNKIFKHNNLFVKFNLLILIFCSFSYCTRNKSGLDGSYHITPGSKAEENETELNDQLSLNNVPPNFKEDFSTDIFTSKSTFKSNDQIFEIYEIVTSKMKSFDIILNPTKRNSLSKTELRKVKDEMIWCAKTLRMITKSAKNRSLGLPKSESQNQKDILKMYDSLAIALEGPQPAKKKKTGEEIKNKNSKIVTDNNTSEDEIEEAPSKIPSPNKKYEEFIKISEPFINNDFVWETLQIIYGYQIPKFQEQIIIGDEDYIINKNKNLEEIIVPNNKYTSKNMRKNIEEHFSYLKDIHSHNMHLEDMGIDKLFEPKIFAIIYPKKIKFKPFKYYVEDKDKNQVELCKGIPGKNKIEISTHNKYDMISTALYLLEKTYSKEIDKALTILKIKEKSKSCKISLTPKLIQEIKKQIEKNPIHRKHPIYYKLLLSIGEQWLVKKDLSNSFIIRDKKDLVLNFGIKYPTEDHILNITKLIEENY